MFRLTPLCIIVAEGKLALAKPLLDYCQAKFMQSLMARPKDHRGPEGILERRRSSLPKDFGSTLSSGQRRTRRNSGGRATGVFLRNRSKR